MAGKAIVSKSNKLNEMRLLSLPAGMGKAELKIANAIYSRVAPEDRGVQGIYPHNFGIGRTGRIGKGQTA